MPHIYNINEDDRMTALNKLDELSDKLFEEEQKPVTEQDSNKKFDLLYQQFMQGLKLNTGIKLF